MKKITVIAIIVTLFCLNSTLPVFSSEIVNPQLEEISQNDDTQDEEAAFAPVDLDLTDYTHLNKENKKFNVKVEKEGKPTVVRSTGQIWDTSKIYRYSYYSDEANMRVLPSYGTLGAYVSTDLDENTKVMVGQDGLASFHGDTINFFYTNGSYYSNGARIEGSMKNFNYMVGAAMNTDTAYNDLAAAISTKPQHILNSKGTFSVGGGIYTNMMNSDSKNTAGLFSQYKNGKFSLGTQIAGSEYQNGSKKASGAIHIMPTYNVNQHLAFKSKIVKDLNDEELQGELSIQFRPLKDPDSLIFNITATNYQSQNTITRQRLKFTTDFKI